MQCFDHKGQYLIHKQGVYPEVPRLLQELSVTFRLGIASHSPDSTAGKGVLKAFGLLHLFSDCSMCVFSSKSKVEHFER
jgi:hypothetical protein